MSLFNRAMKPAGGFTLIEVMLAMTITAFVALLAYSGLSTSISASEEHEKLARRISEIQLPLTVIEPRGVIVLPVETAKNFKSPPKRLFLSTATAANVRSASGAAATTGIPRTTRTRRGCRGAHARVRPI